VFRKILRTAANQPNVSALKDLTANRIENTKLVKVFSVEKMPKLIRSMT
jgi:hypothetical protein